MFIKPALKENKQVSKGRGKGGLATMWDKSLTKYVSLVKCSSFRLQATKFSFPSGTFLLINSYFPCDPQTANFNEDELLNLLLEIRNLLNQEKCVFNLVLGDLNCHFLRQSAFTNIIESFFKDINFKVFWENPNPNPENFIQGIDFTNSQTKNGQMSTSTIDPFVSNELVYDCTVEAGVIHSGDNPSTHSPIFTKLKLGNIDFTTEKVKSSKRVNWSKASEEAKLNYTCILNKKLSSINIPDCVQCDDLHCDDHTEQLEEYTMDILETVEKAARECLPTAGGGEGKTKSHKDIIPGWTEYVKPYCDESKFWDATWTSAGKPLQGPLHDLKVKSKLQYKYAVRRLKRANQTIQNDKFVEGILSGGVDIFTEIKKYRGTFKHCSSRIDDQVGAGNIANHFAGIYSDLYNRHEHGEDFVKMAEGVSSSVGQDSITDVNRITVNIVMKALKLMKNGKNDSIFDFQSDCLTCGSEELAKHLTNMLRSFVSHGTVPYFILVCTLLPLVKDNLADITSSDNYRAIASDSLLLKLLDIVILLLEGDKLECDHLQFGFQAKSSTSMCSWTATAVIEHFNSNGRVVYMDVQWTLVKPLTLWNGWSCSVYFRRRM